MININMLNKIRDRAVRRLRATLFPHNPPVFRLQKQGFSTFSNRVLKDAGQAAQFVRAAYRFLDYLTKFRLKALFKGSYQLSFHSLVSYQSYQKPKAYFPRFAPYILKWNLTDA